MRTVYVAAALLVASMCTATDNSQSSVLVQHAAERSNIRGLDAAPFQLRAKVRVLDGTPVEADYLLIWAAPDRWREEISVGGRIAIRIGGKGSVSSKNDSEQAQAMRQNLRQLDISTVLSTEQGASLSGVKDQVVDGVKLQCVSRTAKLRPRAELCFDSSKGVLVRESFANTGAIPGRFTQFLDYSEFRGKLSPRILRTFQGKTLGAEIEVKQLVYYPDPDPTLFEADTRYKTIAGCEHPEVPRPIKLPDPVYPPQFRTPGPQRVKLSAIVNEIGGVQDIVVTGSAGPLDQYAIKAVEKWKFSPATCGAVPVPFQFFIDENFRTY